MSPPPKALLSLLLLLVFLTHIASSSHDLTLISDSIDWAGPDSDPDSGPSRSLLWGTLHYYISYAALSANRIPCPARSGRSYYTVNCYKESGPVRPYNRGCSAITRCRR
ncbi:hypothetical protein Droror1_Dr00009154 [Drosera rotundifolia]